MRIEDQRLQRSVGIACGRRSAIHDGVEQPLHAVTGLGGDHQDVSRVDAEDLLDL